MDSRIKEVIDTVVTELKNGNVESIAYAVFRSNGDKPSDKWSVLNRMIMYLNDTSDARGFRQWNQVSRHVKKGRHSFHIFAPMVFRRAEKTEEEDETTQSVTYFKAVPVFKIEDTGGKQLPGEDFQLQIPANLMKVVDKLGISVIPQAFSGYALGMFHKQHKEITLMTPDVSTFLHELSHAVDQEIHKDLKGGQHASQEVTAELSAQVIAHLLGHKLNYKSKEYIEQYGWQEAMKVITRVDKIVSYIIKHSEN